MNRIRAARQARAWTQSELAGRARVSPRTIHAVEKGQDCRQATKRKILAALGVRGICATSTSRSCAPFDARPRRSLAPPERLHARSPLQRTGARVIPETSEPARRTPLPAGSLFTRRRAAMG